MGPIEKKIIIDKDFVKQWHPRYDEEGVANDYIGYEDVLKVVSEEISQGFITEATFFRILNWKAPRVKGKIRKNDFNYYNKGIQRAIAASESEKLKILTGLQGIGVPVASTILNFIYPDQFPIMDIRVTEALINLGYLQVKSRSLANYPRYRQVILRIVQESGCSMRNVDRALFAYHKIELNSKQLRKKSNCGTVHC